MADEAPAPELVLRPPSAPPVIRLVPPQRVVPPVEEYIHLYPDRVAHICRNGGYPDDARFPPPAPDIVQALLAANPLANGACATG